MAVDYSQTVAVQILKAIENGITSRDAVTSYVREHLAPLTVTAEEITGAAEGILKLREALDLIGAANREGAA